MEMNRKAWKVSNLVWEWYREKWIKLFYKNITVNLYFKINNWIYMGIWEVLIKNLLNFISFLLILLNFWENENERF